MNIPPPVDYQMQMPRVILFALGIGTILCPSLRGLAQMPVTKVVVLEAELVEAYRTITLVGTVEPLRRSRVSSEIAGLVDEMPGREGDLIKHGGTVCKLNDDTLRFRLAEEEAELATLLDRHEELLAGTRKEELIRLKALLDEAVARHERWKFEMQRIEKLYAGRESNDKEYHDTKAEFLAAQRRETGAQAAYNLGVEGPRKEVIAQAAHAVAEQRAVVARAASDRSKTVLRAPFAGYIVERLVEVGEWIPVGGAVVEMVDLASVLVRVDVPESALHYLVVGAPIRVRIDALKRSLTGRIKHIMRQADQNARTFPVKIEVDNDEGLIAGGMFARATLPAGPTARVVAVPKDGIVERDKIAYVAKLIPGSQGGMAGILSPVTVGAEVIGPHGEPYIAITSNNVQPGTQVITRGTERMLPFPTPVEVVDELGVKVKTSKTQKVKTGALTAGS